MSKDLEVALSGLAAGADYAESVTFPNGRGVSIIRNGMSYGNRDGLFEVAVLDADGELDYSTPVTGDVLGYLTVEDVLHTMADVAALPSAVEA